jgi:hypothetical protein
MTMSKAALGMFLANKLVATRVVLEAFSDCITFILGWRLKAAIFV